VTDSRKLKAWWPTHAAIGLCVILTGCGRSDSGFSREAAAEREKLLTEQVEVERQRAALEREKRELAEARLQVQQSKDADQEFTPDEFGVFKVLLKDTAKVCGHVLLAGTHPTGTFGSASVPVVTLSSNRLDILVTLTVQWNGALSENPYETIYSWNLSKKDRVGTLRVMRDTSIIPIDAQNLRSTELSLEDIFSPLFE